MNMMNTTVVAPPAPKRLEEMKLPLVMMRDIVLKTVFRKSLEMVSDIAEAVCLPPQVVQALIDICRDQKLLEATGTL
ncbi:MAG: ATPase, partial [Rhodobacteraceae bacterium]|nr:ATPase [Paracoccaceae bacterium]